MENEELTLLEVHGIISKHIAKLIGEGWAIVSAETINGDWYPRFKLQRGETFKTVLIKGYNPAPYKLLDDNILITEFWPLNDGKFSRNYDDWLNSLKNN